MISKGKTLLIQHFGIYIGTLNKILLVNVYVWQMI